MKNFIFALTLIAVSSSMTACYRTTLTFKKDAQRPVASEEYNDGMGKWHHGAVYGLVDLSSPVKLDTICTNEVASVYQSSSFVNTLVESLTSNLYNPQSITVYCEGGESTHQASEAMSK